MRWIGEMDTRSHQLSVISFGGESDLRTAITKREKAYGENAEDTESTEERRKDFNTELTEGAAERTETARSVFTTENTEKRKSVEGDGLRFGGGACRGKNGAKAPHSKMADTGRLCENGAWTLGSFGLRWCDLTYP
jgi:hypothetical protein